MSFYHNSKGVNPDADFPVAEEGWYLLKITDAEESQSKNGNDMVMATCKIINDARYPDLEMRHYITFLPPENKGAGISVQFRKAIGVPYGGNDLVDAEEWIGKRFMGFAVQETYEGKTRNKIAKVSPPKTLDSQLGDEPPEPSLVEKVRKKAVAGTGKESDDNVPF